MPAVTAIHVTDPACPWAYSARPAHARLAWRFGDQLGWRLVLIGLSESAAAYEARGYTPALVAAGQRVFQRRFEIGAFCWWATRPTRCATSASSGCRS